MTNKDFFEIALEKPKVIFCSYCKKEKSLDLFGNDKYSKDGKLARCKECKKIGNEKYYIKCNKEERSKSDNQRYLKNKKHINRRNSNWKKLNPDKIANLDVKRRLIFGNATVAWRDNSKIREIYKERDRLTEETGIVHHIIPIQGKTVCGLHVETNLQILTKDEKK